MKSLKSFSKKMLKNQSGQGATEYILLLVVVVALVVMFQGKIKSALGDKVGELTSAFGKVNAE